jgi:Ras-related protein Rab-11A
MLVGNKSDLQHDRAVSLKEAEDYASKTQLHLALLSFRYKKFYIKGDNLMSYIETSALNASNVDLAFKNLVKGFYFLWLISL